MSVSSHAPNGVFSQSDNDLYFTIVIISIMENLLVNLLDSSVKHDNELIDPHYDRNVWNIVTDYLPCQPIPSTQLFPNFPNADEVLRLNEGVAVDRVPAERQWICEECGFVGSTQLRKNHHMLYDCVNIPRQCLPCAVLNCTREELLLHHQMNCSRILISCAHCSLLVERKYLDNHYRYECKNIYYCQTCDCFYHRDVAEWHRTFERFRM